MVWMAFELRPEPVPLPAPDVPGRRMRWASSVLPMAEERGLEMRLPTVAPRTRLAHQAVELARDHQKADGFRRAVFEAFFRDSRDIGRIDVLADIGDAIGLAPALVRRTLEAGTYATRVDEQERLARTLGVDSVPAMLVGDDLAAAEPVIGAVPFEWAKAAVDRALSGESLAWRRRALRSAIPLKARF